MNVENNHVTQNCKMEVSPDEKSHPICNGLENGTTLNSNGSPDKLTNTCIANEMDIDEIADKKTITTNGVSSAENEHDARVDGGDDDTSDDDSEEEIIEESEEEIILSEEVSSSDEEEEEEEIKDDSETEEL